MTFQSLGYVMKHEAVFRVCAPSVLGEVRVFVRALFTDMGEEKGGVWGNSGFARKK